MPWGRHLGGRYPARSRWGEGGTLPGPAGGYPANGVPCHGVLCLGEGGYPARGYPAGGYPAKGGTQVGYPPGQVRMGVPCWGTGVPCWGRGVPCQVCTLLGGTLLGGYPAGGTHVGYPPARSGCGGTLPGGTQIGYPWQDTCPCQVRMGGYPAGGYPVRTTEGVLTTRRAVCLLRSRRRTFLFLFLSRG